MPMPGPPPPMTARDEITQTIDMLLDRADRLRARAAECRTEAEGHDEHAQRLRNLARGYQDILAAAPPS